MPRTLALTQDAPVLEAVMISIRGFSGETVTIDYTTVPGNHPRQNKNTVTLWAGTVIDWSHPELGTTQLVDDNDTNGTYTMENVSISRKNYIVGYSVTGDALGICASALIDGSTLQGGELLMLAPESVILKILSLEASMLVIEYATLRGNKPRTWGNWLGLWRGDIDPYDAGSPVQTQLPPDDVNAGSVTFTTALQSGSTYTVGYFMGDKSNKKTNTTAAALLRFDTQ